MSRLSRLSTTSYAVLGLLSLRSWTTYELAQQMGRSLDRIWPRAESKVYEEPKKLVEHGLARAKVEQVGQRPRTRYTITAKGRRALAAWLAEPGAGPVLESEQLVKVLFAHQGTRSDTLATPGGGPGLGRGAATRTASRRVGPTRPARGSSRHTSPRTCSSAGS